MTVSRQCDVPPEGWHCSRERGHDGPCAASPVVDMHVNSEADLTRDDLVILRDLIAQAHAKLSPPRRGDNKPSAPFDNWSEIYPDAPFGDWAEGES